MPDVVSFRPSDEDLDLIEETRVRMGLATRAEAVRYLLRQGGRAARPLGEDPVFRFRVPKEHRGGADVTSRDIDAALYGGTGADEGDDGGGGDDGNSRDEAS